MKRVAARHSYRANDIRATCFFAIGRAVEHLVFFGDE